MADDRYDKTRHDGKVVDKWTKAALLAAEKELGYELTIVQGSYNKGVGASAGTHDGGGVIDLLPWDQANKVKALRRNGFAAWYRPTLWRRGRRVWSSHIHAVLLNNARAASLAKVQMNAYRNGGTGLASGGRDTAWRPNPIVAFDYEASQKPKPVPPPAQSPTPAGPLTVRVLTLNTIVNRLTRSGKNSDHAGAFTDVQKGENYTTRLPLLADIADRARASIVCTQEAGNYAEGRAFAAAMGSQFASILHGDNRGDLTNAVITDTRKRAIVAEGKIQTSTNPTHHNWATWVLLRDIETGVEFVVGSTHLEYRAKGRTRFGSRYDKIREAQARAYFSGLLKVADGRPVIAAGDFNSSAEQPYDGPGKAAKAAGLTDAYDLAPVRHGDGYSTSNGLTIPPRKSRRKIDRFFVLGFTVNEWGIDVPTRKPFSSDHNGVYVSLTTK